MSVLVAYNETELGQVNAHHQLSITIRLQVPQCVEAIVRGYHAYRDRTWVAAVDEKLPQTGNNFNPFALVTQFEHSSQYC